MSTTIFHGGAMAVVNGTYVAPPPGYLVVAPWTPTIWMLADGSITESVRQFTPPQPGALCLARITGRR